MNNNDERNQVRVSGYLYDNFQYSHTCRGEKFYTNLIACERASGNVDFIPILVSERILDIEQELKYKSVYVTGQFRSFNKRVFDKRESKLILQIFVDSIQFIEEEDNHYNVNEIILDGYICKPFIYRVTALGREIADGIIAVNRDYHKSSYIPCISWGRNASYMEGLEVGTNVKIVGRIQSRQFKMKISETETFDRTVYEVSIKSVEVIQGEDYESRS